MLFNNQFKGNPFAHNSVFNFEDYLRNVYVPLTTVQHMKCELESSVDDVYPIYKLLKGEKGSGKTSALYYLMDSIMKLKKEDIFVLDFKGLEHFNSISHFLSFIEKKVWGEENIFEQSLIISEMRDNIRNKLGNKKIYIFIDVPETRERKILVNFSKTLLYIVGCPNIRIIMSMNLGVYLRLSEHTDLVGRSGKIQAREIEYFNLKQTEELIRKRMEKVNINGSDSLLPFELDSIPIIYKYSNGIPRNIITACDTLFTNADSKKLKTISSDFVSKILKYDYIEGILIDRINDPTRREMMREIITVIKNDFSSEVKNFTSLKVRMKELYGLAPMTVEKRVNFLKKIGLVNIVRSRDNWSWIIKLVGV